MESISPPASLEDLSAIELTWLPLALAGLDLKQVDFGSFFFFLLTELLT